MTINQRIRQLRDHLGMTTREFGKQIGYSGPMVSIIENGRKPEDKLIVSICSVFSVNESWLRDGKGDMFNLDPHPQMSRAEVITDFIQSLLNDLSEANRQVVWEIIQNLREQKILKK